MPSAGAITVDIAGQPRSLWTGQVVYQEYDDVAAVLVRRVHRFTCEKSRKVKQLTIIANTGNSGSIVVAHGKWAVATEATRIGYYALGAGEALVITASGDEQIDIAEWYGCGDTEDDRAEWNGEDVVLDVAASGVVVI